jgi:hypothetical protein
LKPGITTPCLSSVQIYFPYFDSAMVDSPFSGNIIDSGINYCE